MGGHLESTASTPGESVAGPIRVTYRDTDQMGHVYYANYLVWFEIGRTELLRRLGRSYKDWELNDGIYLPVRRCWADYVRPAKYDDLIMIATKVAEFSRASITFEYEIRLADSNGVLATGGTQHAFVNREGRILRVGDKLLPELAVR